MIRMASGGKGMEWLEAREAASSGAGAPGLVMLSVSSFVGGIRGCFRKKTPRSILASLSGSSGLRGRLRLDNPEARRLAELDFEAIRPRGVSRPNRRFVVDFGFLRPRPYGLLLFFAGPDLSPSAFSATPRRRALPPGPLAPQLLVGMLFRRARGAGARA